MTSSADPLAVHSYRDQIVSSLIRERRLIISAPPGSGKSTSIPSFFLDPACGICGTIVVLQPRRVAARALAAWCSRLLGEKTGGTYGYQVRFDTNTSPNTRVIFQTYGVFVRQLLANPAMPGIGLVVLDEFHERTLEMDLVLAWMRTLQRSRTEAPLFMVMSATLDGTALGLYLDNAPVIDIPVRMHPITISYQPPRPQEPLPQQALRALQGCVLPEMTGSILVFMPGTGEIRSCIDLAQTLCGRAGVPLLELHGTLSLDQQVNVLDECAKHPCVVIATNVAETSLTIPGVTTVIDSGWERRAGYDPYRDRNTLRRTAISASSATQRAGRAGRVAPGRCIRLWPESAQAAMPHAYPPEIERLELSGIALTALGLTAHTGIPADPQTIVHWLCRPEQMRWHRALELLADLGAVEIQNGHIRITPTGHAMLLIPADPLPASLLARCAEQGISYLSSAMIAVWENPPRTTSAAAVDVFDTGLELANNPGSRDVSAEMRKSFESLYRLCGQQNNPQEYTALTLNRRSDLLRATAVCWMQPLRKRLAVRDTDSTRYVLHDGNAATLQWPKGCSAPPPAALIILSHTESTGQTHHTRIGISHYVPVEPMWIADVFAPEVQRSTAVRWDDNRQCVTGEVRLTLGAMVLTCKTAPPDAEASAAIITAKLLSREIDLFSDDVWQLVYRITGAATAFPDKGLPFMTNDDWHLIFSDIAVGRTSRKDLENAPLVQAVKEYLGASLAGFIEQATPVRLKLPSGRTGRITYFENAPPELSARIGDFIGMNGRFTVCNGRVEGVFDILAPNMRTVQKTRDLSGFWGTVYPQLRNELKRRYPRHPWP